MEDLRQIIREIKSYSEIKPSDDMILECATRIFISQNISNQKRENIKEYNKAKNSYPATDRQIWVLINKVKMDEEKALSLTKDEASVVINEYKEKKQKEGEF